MSYEGGVKAALCCALHLVDVMERLWQIKDADGTLRVGQSKQPVGVRGKIEVTFTENRVLLQLFGKRVQT